MPPKDKAVNGFDWKSIKSKYLDIRDIRSFLYKNNFIRTQA